MTPLMCLVSFNGDVTVVVIVIASFDGEVLLVSWTSLSRAWSWHSKNWFPSADQRNFSVTQSFQLKSRLSWLIFDLEMHHFVPFSLAFASINFIQVFFSSGKSKILRCLLILIAAFVVLWFLQIFSRNLNPFLFCSNCSFSGFLSKMEFNYAFTPTTTTRAAIDNDLKLNSKPYFLPEIDYLLRLKLFAKNSHSGTDFVAALEVLLVWRGSS